MRLPRLCATTSTILITVFISACSDNDQDREGGVSIGQSRFADWSGELTEDQTFVVDQMKEASRQFGMDYRFDGMVPASDDVGENIQVFFRYRDTNTSGGSPIVLISKASGEIVQISFTQ